MVDKEVPIIATDHPIAESTVNVFRLYLSAAAPAPNDATAKRVVNANEAKRPYWASENPMPTFIARNASGVMADGSIYCNKIQGSIHKVGAEIQNLPSCNGWSYWHFNIEGKIEPIDYLRKKIRDSI